MGQTMSAFGNPVTFEKDPQNFSGSEWAARFTGDAAKGLGKAYDNYQQQNAQMRQGGGFNPIFQQQAPPVPLFSTRNLPGGNPFYGQ